MNDNVIPVGNTPIFQQLVSEMGERKFKSLLSGNTPGLTPVPASKPSFMAPGAWIARNLPKVSPEPLKARVVTAPVYMSPEELADHGIVVEKPLIEDNVSVADLEANAINLEMYITGMVKRFEEKYPGVCPVHISRFDELDGTLTLRVSKGELVEQTDEAVNAAPKPLFAKHLPGAPKEQHEYFHVRGEAATLPPIVKGTFSIGEDKPDTLYMKPSTWGSDEE